MTANFKLNSNFYDDNTIVNIMKSGNRTFELEVEDSISKVKTILTLQQAINLRNQINNVTDDWQQMC